MTEHRSLIVILFRRREKWSKSRLGDKLIRREDQANGSHRSTNHWWKKLLTIIRFHYHHRHQYEKHLSLESCHPLSVNSNKICIFTFTLNVSVLRWNLYRERTFRMCQTISVTNLVEQTGSFEQQAWMSTDKSLRFLWTDAWVFLLHGTLELSLSIHDYFFVDLNNHNHQHCQLTLSSSAVHQISKSTE